MSTHKDEKNGTWFSLTPLRLLIFAILYLSICYVVSMGLLGEILACQKKQKAAFISCIQGKIEIL